MAEYGKRGFELIIAKLTISNVPIRGGFLGNRITKLSSILNTFPVAASAEQLQFKCTVVEGQNHSLSCLS